MIINCRISKMWG